MMKDANDCWVCDEDGEQFEDVEDPKDMCGKCIDF